MRKVSQSDLSDKRWQAIKSYLPDEMPGGRPRETCLREIVNAIFYMNRTDCSWRDIPGDFPPWQTVYTYFSNWRNPSVWKRFLEETFAKTRGSRVSGKCWHYRFTERQNKYRWWNSWPRCWKKDPWSKERYSG